MAVETELKLALGAVDVAAVTAFFDKASHANGVRTHLKNVYFDTPDQALAKARIAIRLRHGADGWLQTLKTAGTSAQGLHSRGEWEMPVTEAALQLAPLLDACEDAAACEALKHAAPRLTATFRTDFDRTTWSIAFDGAKIEAALDQGAVSLGLNASSAEDRMGSSSGSAVPTADDVPAVRAQRIPIAEIELELKDGTEEALMAFAQTLRTAFPLLRPDEQSKAARGYQLLREAASARDGS